jgi:hypothetical protein
MAILYGIGSIKIKTFTLDELNINSDLPNNLSVVSRQTYFHLFFIPFFPLRKSWVGMLQGKYYQLSPEIISQIKLKVNSGVTPWYSFIGMILLFGFFIFLGVNSSIKRTNADNAKEKFAETQQGRIVSEINNTDTTDYYVFRQKSESDKSTIFKVDFVKGDSIGFQILRVNTPAYRIDSIRLSRLKHVFHTSQEKVVLHKENVVNSYPGSFFSSEKKTQGQDFFKNGDEYFLVNIFSLK